MSEATESGVELSNAEAVAAQVAAPDEPRARLPYPFSRRFGVVLSWEGETPTLHTRGKVTPKALHEVRRLVGQKFAVKVHSENEFDVILGQAYQRDSSEAKQLMEDIGNEVNLFSLAEELPQTEDLLDSEDDAPIIKLINAMLSEAIKEGASDIHIETFEKDLVIRFRIDGVLREILRPNRKLASLLVSRIKVMAQLDIAEKRLPQDGRISLLIAGRAVDVRVSTMPSNHGERAVLRLLDKNNARLDLTELGMTVANRKIFSSLIHKPHGIILVTGPTGSGKSTTLYAGLSEINTKDRNILTVEDPIEYALEGVGQMQVNPRVDMTFARGLRAILRQDPDVVMVGEIRDGETAQIAVQASLTGHLVLSTLHTNTAAGAITRLEDMRIEPFLLSSSLLAVLSQRLVRTLCKDCRQEHVATAEECALLGIDAKNPPTIYRPRGCEKCNQTGYRGRTGIHEMLVVDETIRELIHNGQGEQAIERYARKFYPSIRQDGRDKIIAGITTLEEVLRVTREE
ncbi:type II secretion system ATPase GspE [Aliidiomarina sanyensis]|uniref:Type II secretion system protein E n=1 Tax=Aliidiomarina sanyensis TaxID=1249555 RepID=A0A432WG38_9GAMM|nr:type II secretion system ATPase GspE [Aliidiomarina sanyensis]RUO32772.1 type II secretion system protein GspE [Aliidiomarina sanyensis]